jgi:peptidase M23-like protein
MLLILKTAAVVLVLLVWAPAAYAWSWPVQGPVLQPFSFDASHPYDSGQHRGIDIGADAAGEQVVAPTAGTVSFAGSVPTSGECVSIQTSDGYTVTLTHLGTILVTKGTSVAESQVVGTIGPSGTPELDGPYVHLGIRTTSDPNGYLDPLGLLPAQAAQSTPTQSEPAVTQPSASGSSSSAPAQPATVPATSAPSISTTRGSTVAPGQGRSPRHERPRAQKPRSMRPVSHRATEGHRVRLQHRPVAKQTRTARRPVVEATVLSHPTGLDAGHEIQSSAPIVRPLARPHEVANPLPVVLNGVAALVALAAALAAGRRRTPIAGASILHLPRRAPLRRAA